MWLNVSNDLKMNVIISVDVCFYMCYDLFVVTETVAKTFQTNVLQHLLTYVTMNLWLLLNQQKLQNGAN
jgi:hypothetical protein